METKNDLSEKLFSKDSVMVKAVVVAVLVLLMLIPVGMVRSLIVEREASKHEVLQEISSKWGGQQELKGPILVLPYKVTTASEGETKKTENIGYAYFLPEEFKIDGEILPEERSRGIYHVLCYQSTMHIQGKFSFPDYAKLNLDANSIKWDEAFLLIGIPNLQGIKNKISFNLNGVPQEVLSSVSHNDIIQKGLTVKMPLDIENKQDSYKFDFDLVLNGTDGLYFVPIGKQTNVTMKSAWQTATFIGDFLPSQRNVDANGFVASWDIFDYNRNYPQMWLGARDDLSSSRLGVDLLVPVDSYQKTMRSVKYAILFIALTFVVFFMIELLSGKRIHPIQYLLVSFALVLFYSLLLALSEHIGFEVSFLISAIGIIGLITAYSKSVFKNLKQMVFMALFLVALYAFLYVILQLEDMALLLGSVGLFVVLAIVMYVSRKVKWYKEKAESSDVVNID